MMHSDLYEHIFETVLELHQHKKNYFGNSYEKKEKKENVLVNPSSSASFLTNTSNISTSTNLTISMPVLPSIFRTQIKNYIKSDQISKVKQKSLELTFARLIFCHGLFLFFPEIKQIKDL